MKLLQLTMLESGLPCYIPPDNIAMILSGTKLRPVEDIAIGGDYHITFTSIILKAGGNAQVRETPAQVIEQLNGRPPTQREYSDGTPVHGWGGFSEG